MDDRISILPDSILCRILSFLPIEEAIATSVLSKRWKPLWRSVTTLDFVSDVENKHRFVQFVNGATLSRDLHQPIHKFKLTCFFCDSLDSANITAWVDTAAQRGLQELNISILYAACLTGLANLSSVFRCATLVVFRLYGLDLKPFSNVDLPSLKLLHLESLCFSTRESLAELLSGCPGLEDLKASYIRFDSYVTDREFKTLPRLCRADIHVSSCTHFLLQVVNNVEFLHLRLGETKGTHEGGTDDPYLSPVFYNLTRVELFYGSYTKDWSHVMKMLEHCPLLQVLEIKQIYRGILHSAESTNSSVLPMFPKLIHIELSYPLCNMNWLGVVEVLMYCPQLQVLVINQPNLHLAELVDLKDKLRDWQCPQSVPECILLHLKRCNLNGYKGTEREFQFARYIMRKAKVLKSMTICSCTGVKQREKLKNLRKLNSCPRRSATCKLSFK